MFDRSNVLSRIVPVVKDLASDQSQYVRASLASVVMGLASLIGREDFFEHLLPLFLLFLRMYCWVVLFVGLRQFPGDNVADVRLNIISRLDFIHDLVGVDVFTQSLMPAVQSLASDPNWRVRLAIVENVPSVAKQLVGRQ
jgi:serine/threonine-protein phosphatase 2A regulatory subunit A